MSEEDRIIIRPSALSRFLHKIHQGVGDLLPVSEPPILIIRHAQTHANLDKAHFKTVADYAVTLTPEGELQAQTAAKIIATFFKEYRLNRIAIARSTYQRTDQTSQAILDNLPENVTYNFFADVRLREQDYNPLFDGLTDEERAQRFPQAYQKYKQRSFYVDETGGETGAALVARSISFLRETFLPQIKSSDAGLLITHSKTMRALAVAHLNHGTASPRTQDWVNWFDEQKPNNCEIWVMQGKRAFVLFPGFSKDGTLAVMSDRFSNDALFSDHVPLRTLKGLPSNISSGSAAEKASCSA